MKAIKYKVNFDVTFNTGNDKQTDWENVCCNPFRIGESYFDICKPDNSDDKKIFNRWMKDLIGCGLRDYLYVSFGKIPYSEISNVETKLFEEEKNE